MKQNASAPSTVTIEPTPDEIRERAYYLWLEHGCPPNRDQEMWFGAKVLLHDRANQQRQTIQQALDSHQSDPQHLYQNPSRVADRRPAVASSGARQRIRANRPEGQGSHHQDHPNRH